MDNQVVSRDAIRSAATLLYLEGQGKCTKVHIGRLVQAFFENIIERNTLDTEAERDRLPVTAESIPVSVTHDPTPPCNRSIDALFTGCLWDVKLRVENEGREKVSIAYLEDYFNWRKKDPRLNPMEVLTGGIALRVLFPASSGMDDGVAGYIERKLETWTTERRVELGIEVSPQLRRVVCSILVFLALTKG